LTPTFAAAPKIVVPSGTETTTPSILTDTINPAMQIEKNNYCNSQNTAIPKIAFKLRIVSDFCCKNSTLSPPEDRSRYLSDLMRYDLFVKKLDNGTNF
jgi:hypothetical protein